MKYQSILGKDKACFLQHLLTPLLNYLHINYIQNKNLEMSLKLPVLCNVYVKHLTSEQESFKD